MSLQNNETFLELVSDYHKQPEKYVFFVGAGLSQPLFPSWPALLKEFVREAKQGNLAFDDAELYQYIESGQSYLDVAEVCVDAMGMSRYRDLMEATFDKDFDEEDIPDSYLALMDLAPKTIVTTNYDRIPDQAGKGKYRVHTNKNAPEASRNFNNDKNTVFKIHGDITDQSSIVLTTSDYQKIINDNESTRTLLTSLFTTKRLIFIGFSLTDPHIDIILDKIKTINGGLPQSHYVLLNESSKFKITTFEKKYGVKIIPYTPTDPSHPEVKELLQALNHEVSEEVVAPLKPESTVIETKIELIQHLESKVLVALIDTEYTILSHQKDLYISFTPAGETKAEIQKEILSVVKMMKFECELIDSLTICVAFKTQPVINCDESQRLAIRASVSFPVATQYARKQISTSTVWKQIQFFVPPSLTNVYENEELADFPLSLGIIGED
ncbi:TPA: SIR2 family protein [Photobacterium damselae]